MDYGDKESWKMSLKPNRFLPKKESPMSYSVVSSQPVPVGSSTMAVKFERIDQRSKATLLIIDVSGFDTATECLDLIHSGSGLPSFMF